ncbi:MAG: hypothetical protein EWM72_01112 [Nitrospira sp.]|nr:MAG: hypothetical protein EWM72_01112 [Nitrospira sp.]
MTIKPTQRSREGSGVVMKLLPLWSVAYIMNNEGEL